MTAGDTRDLVRRSAAAITADVAFPVAFETASGCTIRDLDGNTYLDFIGGYGAVSVGWQRSEVLEAMSAQLQKACFAPQWLPNREAVALAEAILAVAPASVRTCTRATGGADANEIAFKAHAAERGGQLLVVRRAYHGGTARTLAHSDTQAFRLPLPLAAAPSVPPAYCYRCPYGRTFPGCSLECATAIETALDADPTITGLFLEPVIGSGGAIVPPQAYFDAVQEIVTRRGLTLILDEVMTGCGRVGTLFATDAFGLKPNAITLAKGLTGGYVPLGTALLDDALAAGLKRYEDVSSTLAWTPLATTAALATLNVILADKLADNAMHIGEKFRIGLIDIFNRHMPQQTGDIRGMGLLLAVELVKNRDMKEPHPGLVKRIVLRALRGGLMIGTTWDWNCLLFLPPLILDEATMQNGLDRLEQAVKRSARSSETLHD